MGGSFKREGICIPMADLKKNTYIYIVPDIWHSEKGKTTEAGKIFVVAWDLGIEEKIWTDEAQRDYFLCYLMVESKLCILQIRINL